MGLLWMILDLAVRAAAARTSTTKAMRTLLRDEESCNAKLAFASSRVPRRPAHARV